VIIFPILNVVSTHHFDLSEVGILLPIKKVDFLEELLLMVLELANHVKLRVLCGLLSMPCQCYFSKQNKKCSMKG